MKNVLMYIRVNVKIKEIAIDSFAIYYTSKFIAEWRSIAFIAWLL